MAVFALENGKLVGAPSINDADSQVTGDVLNAVREQVLSLIERPLFGVGWVTADRRDNNQESLIALESTGQIVTIEVIDELDARGLIAAAARAGRYSEYTRRQLVEIYPHGTVDFTKDWNEFLDLTPPVAGKGPRLYLFASTLSDDVREPLLALMGIGVEAQQIIMHPGANGILVELSDISRNRPHLLRARAVAAAIESGNAGSDDIKQEREAEAKTEEAPASNSAVSTTPDSAQMPDSAPSPEEASVEASSEAPSEPGTDQAAEPETDAWGIEESEWEISGWGTTPQLPNLGFGAPPPKREPIVIPQQYRRVDEEDSVGESPEVAEGDESDEAQSPAPRRDTAIMLAERSGQLTKGNAEEPEAGTERPLRRAARRMRRRMPREENSPLESAQEEPKPDNVTAPRAPSALSADDLSGFATGTKSATPARTLYDDVVDSSKRAEQLLWEQAAPKRSSNTLISEDDSARAAALAVARAAGEDVPAELADSSKATNQTSEDAKPTMKTEDMTTGSKRIKNIVDRLGGEAKISWVFPRRGIDLHATLSSDGFIVMPDGSRFTDPAQAARSVANIGSLDAWRGWRTPDGRRLGNI